MATAFGGLAGREDFGERGNLAAPHRILRRHVLLITLVTMAIVAAVGIYILVAVPTYTASASIEVAGYEMGADEVGDAAPGRNQDELRITTQLELLKSLPLARAVVRKLDLTDVAEFKTSTKSIRRRLGLMPPAHVLDADDAAAAREAAVVDQLSKHVSIDRVGQSHLINITARSNDPHRAMTIANAYAALHIAHLRSEKQEAVARNIAMLEERVAQLRQQAVSSERAAASYGRSRSLVGTPSQASDPSSLDWIAGQLATARTGRVEAATRFQQFSGDRASAAAPSTGTSPLVNDLRSQRAAADKRLAELTAQFGPAFPEVVAVRAQRDEIAARLSEELARVERGLAGDVSIARAREAQLSGEMGAVRDRAMSARDAGVGFGDLQSSAQTIRAQYVNQLARLQELRNRGQLAIDASIATAALLPVVASDPKAMPLLALGLIGGLLLGIIAAYVVEQVDDRLRTGEDVRQALGVDTLAMLPELSGEELGLTPQQLLGDQPTSMFSESMRSLYLGLVRRAQAEAPCLLVTSPLPGEGKTTIAASLAASATGFGIDAVVVDLDFRKPSLHAVMNRARPAQDLIAYLTGNATLDAVITRDEAFPRLASIAIADPPRDPGSFMTPAVIGPLVEALKERFQLVILNAPPVLPVSDARTLAGVADATLLVARWGRTRRAALSVAGRLMEGRVTAAALNRVDVRRHAAAAYGDQLQYYGFYASYFGTPPRLGWAARLARALGLRRPTGFASH